MSLNEKEKHIYTMSKTKYITNKFKVTPISSQQYNQFILLNLKTCQIKFKFLLLFKTKISLPKLIICCIIILSYIYCKNICF